MSEPRNENQFSLLDLISGRRAFQFSLIAFGVSGWLALGVNNYFIVDRMKRDVTIQTIDSGGNVWLGTGVAFEKASELHRYCASQALEAGLNWNPAGFDNQAKVELIYRGPAKKYLLELWNQAKDEFAKKQLHQKAEILDIKTVAGERTTDRKTGKVYDVVKALVTVQLTREGVDQGVMFADPPQFVKVTYTLLRNPSLGANGLMPLIVHQMELEVE
ncbi:MAG: hypothetical protein LBK71_12250 [Verrucomicrobiales bacterium]|jgi:hypothetical protein|nr:hypothetical protein [Verrucomicrobiales bacterium]